jgi:hypothetical protein
MPLTRTNLAEALHDLLWPTAAYTPGGPANVADLLLVGAEALAELARQLGRVAAALEKR